MTRRSQWVVSVLVAVCGWVAAPSHGAVQFAGRDCRVECRAVGAHAIRVSVVPADTADVAALVQTPTLTNNVLAPISFAFDGATNTNRTGVAGPFDVAIAGDAPLAVSVSPHGRNSVHTFTMSLKTVEVSFATGNAPILGLGEGGAGFDRRGKVYEWMNGQQEDLAVDGARIFVPLVISTDGFAVLFLSPDGSIDLSKPEASIAGRKGAPPVADFIVFDARDPAAFFADLATVVGHPAVPPRWSLGYLQSHRTLASVDEMLAVAKTFRDKQLPCDGVIYLGTGFCPSGWNTGHDSFTFNPHLFGPREAKDVIADLHAMHFKVALHVVPKNGVQLHGSISARADDAADDGQIAAYWARHKPLIDAGVDAWWPDEGDWMDLRSRIARHAMYFDGPLANRPNVRPWSLHRNGSLGVARYGGWIWSGDVEGTWKTLARQVENGVTASMSVTQFWGTDIGGFWNSGELDGELYARWFQFAAFCPSFRAHGRMWHTRLPWGWDTDGATGPAEGSKFPKPDKLHDARVEPICKAALELRYALLPYTYSIARETHDVGLPLMRALWISDPTDAEGAAIGDEYTWGSELLVAPVVERGATKRRLYLPRGAWYDWWTNERYAGGTTIDKPVGLGTIPLFVKAGAIVPIDPVRQFVDQPVASPTTIRVYRGANGTFTLYDDDGTSMAYTTGAGEWTTFAWDDAAGGLTVSRDPRSQGPAVARTFDVLVMPDGAKGRVEFKGETTRAVFASPSVSAAASQPSR